MAILGKKKGVLVVRRVHVRHGGAEHHEAQHEGVPDPNPWTMKLATILASPTEYLRRRNAKSDASKE